MHWATVGDEADNLVGGLLIARGSVLYRDIFSHHFPFPYYWTALVIGLFGKSIFAVRMSVWLFQIACFAVAMELSTYYLTLGCAAVIWSMIRCFYWGHLVLYSSFSAPSMLIIFSVILATIQKETKAQWMHCLAIALFSVISFLSDPLSIYAIVIAIIFLFTVDIQKAVKSGIMIAAGLGCVALFLVITDSFREFINEALLFNSQIYNKYRNASPIRFLEILKVAIKGLDITDNIWISFNPFKVTPSLNLFQNGFITGFYYRFSLMLLVILLAIKKRFSAAVFAYLFAAALLVNAEAAFRAQPFSMISLVAVSFLITCEFWQDEKNKVLKTIQRTAAVFSFLVAAVVLLTIVRIYVANPSLFSSENALLRDIEANSVNIRSFACGEPNVKLAIYPASLYDHWFTEMRPVSKYLFMLPWVAEIGMDGVIRELDKKDELAIVIVDSNVFTFGKYASQEYLHPLIEYLEKNYVKEADGLFVSPELARRQRLRRHQLGRAEGSAL